jgi:hypothetical protein
MDINRLQNNQENALSVEQKEKVKAVLQELIAATEPTEEFLQEKADALKTVFTEQQKSFLATPPSPPANNPERVNPNGRSDNGADLNHKAGGRAPQGGPGSGNQPEAPDPQAIYQQILDSLK